MILNAVARFAGSVPTSNIDPGAGAPGFMLSLASRAKIGTPEKHIPQKGDRRIASIRVFHSLQSR